MLDIGFRPDIERILRKVPTPHQTLLLSATISADVRTLAHRYMFEPLEVNLSKDEVSVETIQQYYISVNHDRKVELLIHLLSAISPASASSLPEPSAGPIGWPIGCVGWFQASRRSMVISRRVLVIA